MMDARADLWERIGESLQAERRRVTREIASYPTPIAGCDQQFNHLLEQQAAFPAEWARYEEARNASRGSADTKRAATDYLAQCRLLDAAAKSRLAG